MCPLPYFGQNCGRGVEFQRAHNFPTFAGPIARTARVPRWDTTGPECLVPGTTARCWLTGIMGMHLAPLRRCALHTGPLTTIANIRLTGSVAFYLSGRGTATFGWVGLPAP